MAATRACFGGSHQSAHHEKEEEDKGCLRQQASSTTFLLTPPPPGVAFPAPECLHRRGSPSRGAAAAGLNPLSLSLAVGRRTCRDFCNIRETSGSDPVMID